MVKIVYKHNNLAVKQKKPKYFAVRRTLKRVWMRRSRDTKAKDEFNKTTASAFRIGTYRCARIIPVIPMQWRDGLSVV